ncbi:MAG: M24 family metallopeptidase [Aggregatilineales bacterium]
MKSDLDRLMQARDLAAFVIAIDHNYSPPLDYLTDGVHISRGLAIKKQGETPVLIVDPMEREEASATGLPIRTFTDMGWLDMLESADGDRVAAEIVFWGHCLKELGVESGKIGIYGVSDLNLILELVRLMDAQYPEYAFVGEMGTTLFEEAAITKDADEIARMQSVAERTSAVMEATWQFISGHSDSDGVVVNVQGEPLTIGAVKRFVRRELLDRNLEDTGMIFAQGRDGGIPHSHGQDDMALKTGESIVFDLFPREMGGGYHHDMTRTWCIGYAPPHVQNAYEQVMSAFDIAVETFAVGKPTHMMQEAVQGYFEAQGHPTARNQPGTTNGYVHGLGHGIGLQVHEKPGINHIGKEDVFMVGNIITIEPGLYYPESEQGGFGVRVEDTCYVNENGELISITPFRKDLVLPLKG